MKPSLRHSTAVRFALALVAILLLTATRFAHSPVVGTTSPFTLYLPAIILCAWLGGLWLGMFTAIVSGLIGVYFFIAPYYALQYSDPTVLAPLVIFLFVGALIIGLGESLHRSRKDAEAKAIKEREERERFRVTLASIGDAVIATDPVGRVTFMSPGAVTLSRHAVLITKNQAQAGVDDSGAPIRAADCLPAAWHRHPGEIGAW